MDPLMMGYLMQQQQAQQPPAMANNPDPAAGGDPSFINPAALAAMKAAKQSLGMDAEEQRRATGLALMRFFSGMAKPGYGNGMQGVLQGINENLPSAVETYQNEAGRVAHQNAGILQYATQEQARRDMLRMQMIEKARLDAYRNTKQAETERHNRAQEEYNQGLLGMRGEDAGYRRDKMEYQKKQLELKMKTAERAAEKENRVEEALARGETPFESLEPAARTEYQKTVQKKIQEIPVNQRAIETINKMKAIFKKHPNIGSSWIQILNGNKDSGFKNLFFRKMSDPEELAALEMLTKYGSDLGLSTIYSVPSKMATDLLKNMINNAGPNGKLTKKAFDQIAEEWLQRANGNIRLAKKYEDSLHRRVMISTGDMESASSIQEEARGNPYADIPDDQLLELYKQSGSSE